jgi:hypothetical protein
LRFEFQPQSDSAGRAFEVVVSGDDVARGITVGMTVRSEYQEGTLFQGSTPLGQDLFFQYGCKFWPPVP